MHGMSAFNVELITGVQSDLTQLLYPEASLQHYDRVGSASVSAVKWILVSSSTSITGSDALHSNMIMILYTQAD